MSDDLKWAIGIITPLALLAGGFFVGIIRRLDKHEDEIASLHRHHKVLNDNQNREVAMLHELREKWIARFGRNGEHK